MDPKQFVFSIIISSSIIIIIVTQEKPGSHLFCARAYCNVTRPQPMVMLAPMRPASGSQGDHVLYGGGRRLKHRFEYSLQSKAAFVELHPTYMPTAQEFKALLEEVPGVRSVDWQTSKTSQGNVG